MDRNHHFTPEEQAEYDKYAAAGRNFYDLVRLEHGFSHKQAISLLVAGEFETKADRLNRKMRTMA